MDTTSKLVYGRLPKRCHRERELTCDWIICGINSERIQARLLREEDLTLEKAINICKADEESRKELKDLTKDDRSKVKTW